MDKCRLGFSCEDLAEWLDSRSHLSCEESVDTAPWVQYLTLVLAVLSATLSAIVLYRQNRRPNPPVVPGNCLINYVKGRNNVLVFIF